MVTILLEKIISILTGWFSAFKTWAENVAEKLGLIEEQAEYIDDISENVDSITADTSGIKTDTGLIRLTLNNANARLTQIYSDTSTIKNNVGSISTNTGISAAFAEDCATNGLNILDKVTTIASDTTQMRADNAVVKTDLDKIYDAIRWSLINVLMTETESGSSPLVFDTDKAEPINDLVCNIALTETGSGTKSPSNPYTISSISNLNVDVNGNTFTFALGQTVYGGYYDFTTGKLVVTHEIIDMGDLSWVYYPDGANPLFRAAVSGTKQYTTGTVPNINCSTFEVVQSRGAAGLATNLQDNQCSFISNGSNFTARCDAYTDAPTFTNAVRGKKLVYELATPIESTLTAQAITALIGLNTISSNGNGEIAVTYTESVKHYLDKQEA